MILFVGKIEGIVYRVSLKKGQQSMHGNAKTCGIQFPFLKQAEQGIDTA